MQKNHKREIYVNDEQDDVIEKVVNDMNLFNQTNFDNKSKTLKELYDNVPIKKKDAIKLKEWYDN